ncbi:Nuclease-related domain protein [Planococcus massiliensis]|uniref:Nuclease-related domain protein n=1 Tax=Planococcus massiliensis TaxID=1499687 RepID=A0A098EP47_9BACL|nr:nuclease-related domain-containing protein [Planococcus massiliensis]CEG23071.1 Nuclease-related domain protein [Planococcus massiliensis]
MNERLLAQMVLVERLSKSHPAWNSISSELKSSLAGAGGEQRTLSLLKRELILPGETIILTDLSIPNGSGYAQVDLLVVNQKLVCVLEVKNMKGDFYFDSENFQFHRMVDGRPEGMKSPESQLHRAVKATERFLGIPVAGVIVLASRSGRVVEGPKNYPAVSLDYLPFYLESLVGGRKLVDEQKLAAKVRALPKRSFDQNLLERYGLRIDSLRLGVTCPRCRNSALSRKNRKWHCGGGGGSFHDAHEVTLQEYAVLFGAELPTSFAYRLLGVEDKHLLYRLLEKSALRGNERGRRWIVPRRELLEAYFGSIWR